MKNINIKVKDALAFIIFSISLDRKMMSYTHIQNENILKTLIVFFFAVSFILKTKFLKHSKMSFEFQ